MSARRLFVVLGLAFVLFACGGKAGAPGAAFPAAADADPLMLLPGSAIAVVSVDARAMYAASVGPTLGSFASAYVPLGDDSGFQASRDVDRLLLSAYASNEADVAVVLSGRFDVARIGAATGTRSGAAFVKGTYAGFTTLTAGQTTVAPLSARTLVGGTTERVHRVLDRVGPGAPKLDRAVPPWVAETLASQGAQFAVTADFATQPVASATFGSINLTFLQGLRMVRAIGDFDAPGLNVAATLTYGDPPSAQAAADNMRLIGTWQTVLAPLLMGAKLSNLQVGASGADVQSKFAVDDTSLRALLLIASKYLQPPAP
jgi:hypothetical protein